MKRKFFIVLILIMFSVATNNVSASNLQSVGETSETVVVEGDFGSSHWFITDTGILHIESGTFDNTPIVNTMGVSPWYNWRMQIKRVQFDGPVIAAPRLNNLFDGFENVTSIDNVHLLNTSNTTSMQRVFGGCKSLTSIDLTSWDVSKVTDIFSFFNGAINMEYVDVSNWDTSSITRITYAFSTMSKLKSLDLSNWHIVAENVAQGVFMGDSSLEYLDLSGFDMSHLNDGWGNFSMVLFFQDTTSLSKIKVSESFRLISSDYSSPELPEIIETDVFTGKWQNVGSGTASNPQGTDVWTSNEFMEQFNSNAKSDTYVWQQKKIQAQDVDVMYLDEGGRTIATEEMLKGYVGESYSTQEKSIPGYTLKEIIGNTNGIFSAQKQYVKYIYKLNPIIGADVIVKYLDEDGNVIADQIILNGNQGDSYTTQEKNIPGYILESVEGNTTGYFTNTSQTVTYIYKQEKAMDAIIIIRYVDEAGVQIVPEDILKGYIGDKYNVAPKIINGYTLISTKGSEIGTFTNDSQLIEYEYRKQPNTIPQTGDNRNLVYFTSMLLIAFLIMIKKINFFSKK